MKKTLLFLAIVFVSLTVSAQNATGPELSVGLDATLPIGNFKEGYNFGIGGTAKFAYNFTEQSAATFQTGYISFGGKTLDGFKIPAAGFIPFKAGYRYTTDGGIYFEPQLGFTSISVSGAGSTTGFTYAFNAGYRLTPGLDASIRYETVSKSGNSSFLGLRLAYGFSFGK